MSERERFKAWFQKAFNRPPNLITLRDAEIEMAWNAALKAQPTADLISAAEAFADNWDDEQPERVDVVNAFYAGACWQERRQPTADTVAWRAVAEMMDAVIEGAAEEFVRVPYGASHEDVAAINEWHKMAAEARAEYERIKP